MYVAMRFVFRLDFVSFVLILSSFRQGWGNGVNGPWTLPREDVQRLRDILDQGTDRSIGRAGISKPFRSLI